MEECPKCGALIDKNTMVCPNCKKVLRMICPVCRTINEKNICKKCGEILITRCAKCGKITPMEKLKCTKCGYSLEKSAIKNESNTDDFAVLKIDFANKDAIKTILGSNPIYNKFFSKLDLIILKSIEPYGIRRQIVNNKEYILRFNKDYTLKASANSAIEATLEIIKNLINMNAKMLKSKNLTLKCNFSIFKKNIEDEPYETNIGFNANLVSQSESFEDKIAESFQIILNEDFYDLFKDKYEPETLDSVLVNGQMRRFYEIKVQKNVRISDYIKIEEEKEDIEIPSFVQNILDKQDKITKEFLTKDLYFEEDLYSNEAIDFEGKNCIFVSVESINILDEIFGTLKNYPKGILSIKADEKYMPYTIKLLSAVDQIGQYDTILPITCTEDMKYFPYSFFRELLMAIFEYSVSSKTFDQNTFSDFETIDKNGLIRSLINLESRELKDISAIHNEYIDIFLSIIETLPQCIFYIENFEKMDESSKDIMEEIFAVKELENITFLVSYGSDFSLHKRYKYLISRKDYKEINVIPTSFNKIIKSEKHFYKNVVNDFYMQRIEKYACGSLLFLDYVIQYLIEEGIYSIENEALHLLNPQTILIPSSLDHLVQRRLNMLKDNEELLILLAQMLLIGPRIDKKTLQLLEISDLENSLEELANMGYIYYYDDNVYFSNYNLVKRNIFEVIDNKQLDIISKNIFTNYLSEDSPNILKVFLYKKMEQFEEIIPEWEKLANLNLSLGDFPAYLNCIKQILLYLEEHKHEWTRDDLSQYKLSIYKNIAINMTSYQPVKCRDIAEIALSELKDIEDTSFYTSLGIKMIQGSLDYGEYKQGLTLIDDLMKLKYKNTIDPVAKNFDLEYLLLAILRIRALFHTGNFQDCIKFGYIILNVIDSKKLESIELVDISFEDFAILLFDFVSYMATAITITLSDDAGQFVSNTSKFLNFITNDFLVFSQVQKLMLGIDFEISEENPEAYPFLKIFSIIIRSFKLYKNNPRKFAQEIYNAKLVAQSTSEYSLELFIDSLIGYSYIQNNYYKKAEAILDKVLQVSKDKGLTAVEYAALYIKGLSNYKQRRYDNAIEILNYSIAQMEKSGQIIDYMLMLNKLLLGEILKKTGNQEKSNLCLAQANYIMNKYNITLSSESEQTQQEDIQTIKLEDE